jgi:hypothetical protein
MQISVASVVIIRIQLLAGCPPFAAPSAIHIFEASLSHLWSIWECLVLCEPILFFGQTPAWTSKAIWWMRDVFRPVRTFFASDTSDVDCRHVTQIPWAGDFRPYFTIHDREHAALVNDRRPKSGLLLGVTNPFYEKACSHWPHVLRLGGKSRQVRLLRALLPVIPTTIIVARVPQRVSLVWNRGGRPKLTNGIRLKTASSSSSWKP